MEAPPPQAWEAFFTPMAEPVNDEDFPLAQVVKVNLTGCTLEELSSVADVTWENFRHFLDSPDENGSHRIVSTEPGVILTSSENINVLGYLFYSGSRSVYRMSQGFTGEEIFIWTADGYEQATSSGDFLLGLLAGAEQPNFACEALSDASAACPVSGSAIGNYLAKSNDNLTGLCFNKCIFNDSHFKAIANAPASRGLQLILDGCIIDSSTTPTPSFWDGLGKDQGANHHLWNCQLDPILLSRALTTSNRITSLVIGELDLDDRSVRVICQAVADSKSIESFDASGIYIDDKSWSAICKSLCPHPTLLTLVIDLNRGPHGFSDPQMPIERMESRMNDVLSLMHVNSVLKNEVTVVDSDGPPIPEHLSLKLETRFEMNENGFEEQCQSLGPLAANLRPKLLGRALYMARLNPKLIWKFLSEHIDVVAEAADARTVSNLDESAKRKRKQVDEADQADIHRPKKRPNRASSD